MLREAFYRGSVQRGEAKNIAGYEERRARETLSALLDRGYGQRIMRRIVRAIVFSKKEAIKPLDLDKHPSASRPISSRRPDTPPDQVSGAEGQAEHQHREDDEQQQRFAHQRSRLLP